MVDSGAECQIELMTPEEFEQHIQGSFFMSHGVRAGGRATQNGAGCAWLTSATTRLVKIKSISQASLEQLNATLIEVFEETISHTPADEPLRFSRSQMMLVVVVWEGTLMSNLNFLFVFCLVQL